MRDRHEVGLDASRPEAVQRRHSTGKRTARENLADLVDDGSFVEYGPLLFAAQERRRSREELIARTPADGLVGGIGEIDGLPCVAHVLRLHGARGNPGHAQPLKKDRLFEIAERRGLPVVLFAEGGGGRPGDVDMPIVAGLDCRAFELFARLSGRVPLIGIASGYCFAGNAALLGCCDVVIATEDSSIGMGGPAMIEGGGLGVHLPGDVGPIDVQHANGVVDVRVADERAVVAAAKRYLSYFRGALAPGPVPDQGLLRELIPAQRKRIYQVRRVIDTLFDEDSVLELRDGFGAGMLTALARVDGRPLGVSRTTPHTSAERSTRTPPDKAARFLQLCDAFELPVLFLCDTPGLHGGARRRAHGDGAPFRPPVPDRRERHGADGNDRPAQGLRPRRAGDGRRAASRRRCSPSRGPRPSSARWDWRARCASGMRRELDAVEDPQERERLYEQTVAAAYERGQGINMAAYGEIDDVIDPADSRPMDSHAVRARRRLMARARRQEAPAGRRLVS